jgi:enamine deaminase RidA (YjgF/YER057c/UK114 family)
MDKMRRISSPAVPEPAPKTWSNCKVVGNQVYIAGMISRAPDGSIAGASPYDQAKIIFGKIKALMEAAGGKIDDVIKVNIYVTDIKRREEVWKARAECFSGDFPCSTLVEVSGLAQPEVLVEIEAIGFIGAGAP